MSEDGAVCLFRYAIGEILSTQARELIVENIHARLREIRENVEADQVAVEKFVITKSLTKNPDDYPDKNSLPHVQVALRLRSKGKHFRSGDTVPYIVCLVSWSGDVKMDRDRQTDEQIRRQMNVTDR